MEPFRFRVLVIVGVLILVVSGFLPWVTATYGSFVVNVSLFDLFRGSSFQLSDVSAFSVFFYACGLIAALIALVRSRLVVIGGLLALAAGILFMVDVSDFGMVASGNGNVIVGLIANSVVIGIGPISAIIAGAILLVASILRKSLWRAEEEPTLPI